MPDCVAIIPAKGHSRRLPGKNLRVCAGKTLVERAVECALDAGIFCKVIVSTESVEILDHLDRPEYNRAISTHVRYSRLSDDGVSVAAVIPFALAYYAEPLDEEIDDPLPDSFCVLWPTTPTRTPEVLRAMWEVFEREHLGSLHSVTSTGAGLVLGDLIHEGTAIFMRTPEFLKRLSLDLRPDDPVFQVWDSVDVNTGEDLARAEVIILAREAACPSR